MWYDCLAVAILAFTTIRGAAKGVIWQIAAIAGLVVCFVFSESISAAAGPYVKLEPPLNNWVVMIGAYLVFSFAAFAVARLLTEWLDKIRFGDFNRHLGALFGFVKGVVIVLVLTFFSVTVSERMHEVLQNSRTGPIAANIMYHLHPVMPEKLHDSLARYINIHKLDDPELQRKYQDRDLHDGHVHDAVTHDSSDLILPPDFEEVLSNVPEETQGEFRTLLMKSLNQSQPESRVNLLDSLIDAFREVKSEDDLTSVMTMLKTQTGTLLASTFNQAGGAMPAERFETAHPTHNLPDQNPEATGSAATLSRRDQLLYEISSEFSQLPNAQKLIREDIESQLAGVPEAVVVSVLEDWRSDLIRARPGETVERVLDPDPTTTAATPLEDRIKHQMAQNAPEAFEGERLQ